MEEHEARFALPSTTSVPGLREMQASDVPAVGRLLRRYMARFDMAPRFSDAEVRHMFVRAAPTTPAAQPVIWAYVVEAPNGSITDFFSFYNLPSSVLGNEKHDTLAAAYLFYYASDAAFDNEATPSTSDEASHTTSHEERSPRGSAATRVISQRGRQQTRRTSSHGTLSHSIAKSDSRHGCVR